MKQSTWNTNGPLRTASLLLSFSYLSYLSGALLSLSLCVVCTSIESARIERKGNERPTSAATIQMLSD